MWMIGEELASISGKRFEKIFVSGGFLKSEAWAQMFADISGKSLVKGAQEDASGLGAAKIGWKALGETVEIKEERKIYLRPNMANYQKYRLIFESFKAIVRSKFDKAE
jgi:sugar (pentulose or hexulose) kinase